MDGNKRTAAVSVFMVVVLQLLGCDRNLYIAREEGERDGFDVHSTRHNEILAM